LEAAQESVVEKKAGRHAEKSRGERAAAP